jgi:hypothetical protein
MQAKVKNWARDEFVEVAPGDVVGFKSDVEQTGRIVRITTGGFNRTRLVLENPLGFQGGYIGGETETIEDADDCWVV